MAALTGSRSLSSSTWSDSYLADYHAVLNSVKDNIERGDNEGAARLLKEMSHPFSEIIKKMKPFDSWIESFAQSNKGNRFNLIIGLHEVLQANGFATDTTRVYYLAALISQDSADLAVEFAKNHPILVATAKNLAEVYEGFGAEDPRLLLMDGVAGLYKGLERDQAAEYRKQHPEDFKGDHNKV